MASGCRRSAGTSLAALTDRLREAAEPGRLPGQPRRRPVVRRPAGRRRRGAARADPGAQPARARPAGGPRPLHRAPRAGRHAARRHGGRVGRGRRAGRLGAADARGLPARGVRHLARRRRGRHRDADLARAARGGARLEPASPARRPCAPAAAARPPPDDLHAALALAHEQREQWQLRVGPGARPQLPAGLDETERLVAGVREGLDWLGGRLTGTSDGGDLAALPVDALTARLQRLAGATSGLSVLPRVVALRAQARRGRARAARGRPRRPRRAARRRRRRARAWSGGRRCSSRSPPPTRRTAGTTARDCV
nr:hypothetical protein [Angustibacter aerolatus]